MDYLQTVTNHCDNIAGNDMNTLPSVNHLLTSAYVLLNSN